MSTPSGASPEKVRVGENVTNLVRSMVDLTATGAAFGISYGPDVPDLQTARGTPEVQQAAAAFRAASNEMGAIKTLIAMAEWIKDELGLTIPL